LSVHLVNGIWGTLCVGLFAAQTGAEEGLVGLFYGGGLRQLGVQAIGIATVGVFAIGASIGSWGLVKAIAGLRVSPDEEYLGLDMSEMGIEAYPEDATTRLYAAAKEA